MLSFKFLVSLVMFSFPLLMLFIWLYLFFFYFFFNNSPVIYLFCTYFFSVSLLLCNFGLFVGSNFLFAEEHTLEVSFLKSDTSELKFGWQVLVSWDLWPWEAAFPLTPLGFQTHGLWYVTGTTFLKSANGLLLNFWKS